MDNQYLGDDRIVHETLNVPKASSYRIYSDSKSSNDIVTILRREYDCFNNDGVGDYELLTIAADEIERLQEQIQTVNLEWRDLIDQTQEKAFAEIERLRAELDSYKSSSKRLSNGPIPNKPSLKNKQTNGGVW